MDAAGKTPSVFFAFRSELERDRAAAAIAQQPSLGTSLPGGREVASACGSLLEVSPIEGSAIMLIWGSAQMWLLLLMIASCISGLACAGGWPVAAEGDSSVAAGQAEQPGLPPLLQPGGRPLLQ